MASRVVALIDMDAFYCACERALDPELIGVPMAVVQYNPGQGDGRPGATGVVSIPAEPSSARVAVKGGKVIMPSAANGGIIAVSYEARARGVSRHFRGREAVAACPELVIVQVPTAHGKSNMGLYRDYGKRILNIVAEMCGPGALTEKASVDEMYVDVTAPARRLLAEAGSPASLFEEALALGTHVAGGVEGAEEASRGSAPVGEPLNRSSFRSGHAGQVVRAVDEASTAWWRRDAAEWSEEEQLLAAGTVIVGRARAEVGRRLPSFSCSAGVAVNKMMAKLCGGLHKPDQQTVLPASAVLTLLDPLPVDRLRGFGGKLGELLRGGRPDQGLPGYATAGALRQAGPAIVSRLLQGEWSHPEDTAAAACRMAAGLDDAPVAERKLSKQVGSGKNFNRGLINTREALEGWVRELSEDVGSRLAMEAEENGRAATRLVAGVSVRGEGGDGVAKSKRCPLRGSSVEEIARDVLALALQLLHGRPATQLGISGLYLSAEAFVSTQAAAPSGSLKRFFEDKKQAPVAANGATGLSQAQTALECAAYTPGSSAAALGFAALGFASAPLPRSGGEASAAGAGDPAAQISAASTADVSPSSEEECWLVEVEAQPLSGEAPQKRARSEATGGAAVSDQQWACSECTLLNSPALTRCDVCGFARIGARGRQRAFGASNQQPSIAAFFRS